MFMTIEEMNAKDRDSYLFYHIKTIFSKIDESEAEKSHLEKIIQQLSEIKSENQSIMRTVLESIDRYKAQVEKIQLMINKGYSDVESFNKRWSPGSKFKFSY